MDIFDIENLPDELEVTEWLTILSSDWCKKPGDIVSVTYNIQEGYWGRRSGMWYEPRIETINIEDCDYPVSFFPNCFKIIKK